MYEIILDFSNKNFHHSISIPKWITIECSHVNTGFNLVLNSIHYRYHHWIHYKTLVINDNLIYIFAANIEYWNDFTISWNIIICNKYEYNPKCISIIKNIPFTNIFIINRFPLFYIIIPYNNNYQVIRYSNISNKTSISKILDSYRNHKIKAFSKDHKYCIIHDTLSNNIKLLKFDEIFDRYIEIPSKFYPISLYTIDNFSDGLYQYINSDIHCYKIIKQYIWNYTSDIEIFTQIV